MACLQEYWKPWFCHDVFEHLPLQHVILNSNNVCWCLHIIEMIARCNAKIACVEELTQFLACTMPFKNEHNAPLIMHCMIGLLQPSKRQIHVVQDATFSKLFHTIYPICTNSVQHQTIQVLMKTNHGWCFYSKMQVNWTKHLQGVPSSYCWDHVLFDESSCTALFSSTWFTTVVNTFLAFESVDIDAAMNTNFQTSPWHDHYVFLLRIVSNVPSFYTCKSPSCVHLLEYLLKPHQLEVDHLICLRFILETCTLHSTWQHHPSYPYFFPKLATFTTSTIMTEVVLLQQSILRQCYSFDTGTFPIIPFKMLQIPIESSNIVDLTYCISQSPNHLADISPLHLGRSSTLDAIYNRIAKLTQHKVHQPIYYNFSPSLQHQLEQHLLHFHPKVHLLYNKLNFTTSI